MDMVSPETLCACVRMQVCAFYVCVHACVYGHYQSVCACNVLPGTVSA